MVTAFINLQLLETDSYWYQVEVTDIFISSIFL